MKQFNGSITEVVKTTDDQSVCNENISGERARFAAKINTILSKHRLSNNYNLDITQDSIGALYDYMTIDSDKNYPVELDNFLEKYQYNGVAVLAVFLNYGDESYLKTFLNVVYNINHYSGGADIKKALNNFATLITSGKKLEAIQRMRERICVVIVDFFCNGFVTEKDGSVTSLYLEAELQGVSNYNLLMAAHFQAVKDEDKDISFEDYAEFEQIEKTAPELTEKEKEEIRRIYFLNYKTEPQLQGLLMAGLDDVFSDPKNSFYLLKILNKISAFYRLEDMGGGVYHFGAFNTEPFLRGFGLGQEIMEKHIRTKMENGIVIEATCTVTNPFSAFYIEHGFIATNAMHLGEKLDFEIWRNDLKNDLFHSKKMTEDEISAIARGDKTHDSDVFVISADKENLEKVLELPENSSLFIPNEGHVFVLTRYIAKKHSSKVFIVLEKVSTSDLSDYKYPKQQGKS